MRPFLIGAAIAATVVLSACGSDAPEVSQADPPATPTQESTQDEATVAQDTAEDTSAEEPAEPEEERSGELGLGGIAEVGDYTVAVTEVQLNANDALQAANSFNEAPEGQYVLVSLDVTYNGDEEADPWLDLFIELAGSDARVYDTSTCMAVTPNTVMDVPTLTAGGQATFDVCFDVPQEALDNPKIYVEDSMSFDDTRAIWNLQDDGSTGARGDGAAEDDQDTEDKPVAENGPDELAIGGTAEVGDYTVAVTEVQLNANDALQATNSFNEAPEGQYVLVSLDVTYNGDEEADPWLDLFIELAGSDARVYDTSTCMAVTPNTVMDVPTLTAGGQATFDVCFDVPQEALDNPKIYVEDSMSFDDTRAIWQGQ
ncbi:DUF4352 domain-containing protein [Ornithinimicrobium sp. F0845]|uniref:DUF4352 domain-containing protein n=1 Tax=Ornithinimicrobium sp. F0845 TaxID=2926412 RepID=UPI001FF5B4F8|nr:DUF4352 domain-containing protein [Ornithinimicrobium sp. F0845]MCK0112465.1 DUF4352 domain-containing protein [Ornithinimicrobium sp. F0845]